MSCQFWEGGNGFERAVNAPIMTYEDRDAMVKILDNMLGPGGWYGAEVEGQGLKKTGVAAEKRKRAQMREDANFPRPTGRAPKNKKWCYETGVWVVQYPQRVSKLPNK